MRISKPMLWRDERYSASRCVCDGTTNKGDSSLPNTVPDSEKSVCILWTTIRLDPAWRCGALRRERHITHQGAAAGDEDTKILLIESIDTHPTTTF